MRSFLVRVGISAVLAASIPFVAQCEELKEGTWSGTWVGQGRRGSRPRNVSIEVKNTPDPHWRWRSAKRELQSAIYASPVGQKSALSDVRLENGTLTFSYLSEEIKVSCRLTLGDEGIYEGDCKGENGAPGRLSLTPPETATAP